MTYLSTGIIVLRSTSEKIVTTLAVTKKTAKKASKALKKYTHWKRYVDLDPNVYTSMPASQRPKIPKELRILRIL